MRAIVLTILLFSSCAAWGENAYGTFSADGTSTAVNLRNGLGNITLTGTWGSGTVAVQVQRLDTSWEEVKTYTSADAPDVTPVVYDFGAPVKVRLVLSSATSPSLYWEIRESGTR